MKHLGILILGKSDLGLSGFFQQEKMPHMYRKFLEVTPEKSLVNIITENIDTVILCDDSVPINEVIEFCQKNEWNLLSLSGEKVSYTQPLNFVFNEMPDEYNESSILSEIRKMREQFKNMQKTDTSLSSQAQAS